MESENKKYIHYGHKKFERERFCSISNEMAFVKPIGGLWASPVDCDWGWKDWCKDSGFRKCKKSNSFTFTLKTDANVAHIFSINDLHMFPRLKNEYILDSWYCFDFEKMLKDGIDAVELHLSEEDRSCCSDWQDGLYWQLYGWDCDSILIMNPDVVVCGKE